MSEVLGDAVTGAPTERLVRLYERWGRGGTGLLITGNVMVGQDGRAEVGNVVVEDERDLDVLRRWAAAAQAHGAQLWMQINHGGRQCPRSLNRAPVAPSAVPMRAMGGMFATPRELEAEEIEEMIERFARTAAIAKKAGFSGVQIHAAHGYLVSQFLSPLTNQRDDAWGGDAVRRMRFLLEIVKATRAAVGSKFPIGVKLNSADFQRGGFSGEDAVEVARAIEEAGVDLLEVSGGSYESPAMVGRGELPAKMRKSSLAREAYFLEYARDIRAAVRTPILLTGGMRTLGAMTEAIGCGAVDVIGLARPLAYEPDLPARLLDGSATEAKAIDLRTGMKRLDDMLQIFWFQLQLRRMGDGLDPKPGLSRAAALFYAVWMNLKSALAAKKIDARLRPRLATS